MPIGLRANHSLCGDIACGPRAILDHEWLAESLGQPLADQARDDVSRAAGGKTDDNPYRSRRIRESTGKAAAPAARCKNVRRGSFIGVLLPHRLIARA
jgi:hypothetical protein